MIIDILNKIMFMLLVMSCLNTLRHFYYFIQAIIVTTNTKSEKANYLITKKSLFLLGLSISYIIMVIFTGINF